MKLPAIILAISLVFAPHAIGAEVSLPYLLQKQCLRHVFLPVTVRGGRTVWKKVCARMHTFCIWPPNYSGPKNCPVKTV